VFTEFVGSNFVSGDSTGLRLVGKTTILVELVDLSELPVVWQDSSQDFPG
jgi:hypothetical protein